MRKRILAVFGLCLLWGYSGRVEAATFLIDLNTVPTVPNTGEITELPSCDHGICALYEISPVYELSALGLSSDATVNLGELTYASIGFCGPYGTGCGYSFPFFAVAFNGGTLPNADLLGGGTAAACIPIGDCYEVTTPSQTVQLVYPVSDTIQFEYSLPAIYALPEPSTWAMLLIGFACLGFLALREKFEPA
jgi:hypothetical protein